MSTYQIIENAIEQSKADVMSIVAYQHYIDSSRQQYAEAVTIRDAGGYWDQYRAARQLEPDYPAHMIRTMIRHARQAVAPHWEGLMYIGYSHLAGVYPAFGRSS